MRDPKPETGILDHINRAQIVAVLRDCGREHLRALAEHRLPRIVPLLAPNLHLMYLEQEAATPDGHDAQIRAQLGIGLHDRALPAVLWPLLLRLAWDDPLYAWANAQTVAAVWRERVLSPDALTAPVIAWQTHAQLLALAIKTVQADPQDKGRQITHRRLLDLGGLLSDIVPEALSTAEWDTWALTTAQALWVAESS